jgi:hypothetical protein
MRKLLDIYVTDYLQKTGYIDSNFYWIDHRSPVEDWTRDIRIMEVAHLANYVYARIFEYEDDL